MKKQETLPLEVVTYHGSFFIIGVVLALKEVNQEKQHVKETTEMDDMML